MFLAVTLRKFPSASGLSALTTEAGSTGMILQPLADIVDVVPQGIQEIFRLAVAQIAVRIPELEIPDEIAVFAVNFIDGFVGSLCQYDP